jgi:hypothetical protein
MKTKTAKIFVSLTLILNLSSQISTCLAQNTAFTYQGRLSDGASLAAGLYDLRFSLHDDAVGGNNMGLPLTNSAVRVTNGLFTTTLDFGQGVFDGRALWLQIAARTNGAGAFAFLSSRQSLTPTPYSLRAANAGTVFGSGILGPIGDANLSLNIARLNGANQVFTGVVTLTNTGNVFAGTGTGLTGLNAWALTGNAGISPGTQFLGTTDRQPLELRVNGARALRLQPDPRPENVPNLIGGFVGNTISSIGVGSSVIVGGGWSGGPNIIQDNSSGSFIGAGSANIIRSDVYDSVIGGGYGNIVMASDAVIVGGLHSTNAGPGAAIGGGNANLITDGGADGVIGGGAGNRVSARGATVPGGYGNSADGEASLAAGYRAKANHNGTFVWGDRQEADFASTVANQFAVRAGGGAVFLTGDASLQVQGSSLITQMATNRETSHQLAISHSGNRNRALNLGCYYGSQGETAGVIEALDGGQPAWLHINPSGGQILLGWGSELSWGDHNFSKLKADQGGSIEIGNSFLPGVTPYIDFLYGSMRQEDYNVRVINDGDNQVSIFRSGSGTPLARFNSGGLTVNGTFVGVSDRNAKENFEAVDPQAVLEKVAALPITEWNFKTDPSVKHLGPVAQDFRAAFGVGPDDKHIATVDAEGVALAATQGLNRKLEDRSQRAEVRGQRTEDTLDELKAENAELKTRLAALERLVAELAAKENETWTSNE